MNADQAHDLLSRLLHRIAPEIDLGDIPADAALQDEVDLDSMDFLNLVTAIHDEAHIDIPERDYPRLTSVAGFVDYLVAASA